ncbi:Methyltransferase domain-containing protein [Burkholderia sp. YR290]|nr:Methyltransferase domain-containing protein [Burkholderia sp. YR290]
MSIYASPRHVHDLSECYFYHTMELPGIGVRPGNWDLRGRVGEYLGNVDFSGMRVLDIGCASGALSFYMEGQGAEVVSYDLDSSGDWDMVPFAKWEHYRHISDERKQIINRLNNSYWIGHSMLHSKAKVVYGDVYHIPEAIGPVDIAVFGSVLLHFRDPFLALQQALRLTKQRVVVTEVLRTPVEEGSFGPTALGFLPDYKTLYPKDTWWDIPPAWTIQALGVLGFENAQVTYHSKKYDSVDNNLYTVVADRVAPSASL